MRFRYFAYGSNMWLPQIRSICPSATVAGLARLDGWRAAYDKPSRDGSSKLNIRPDPSATTDGVLFEIDESEREVLELAEPRYEAITVSTDAGEVLTFAYRGEPDTAPAYDWYVSMIEAGGRHHGVSTPRARSVPEPGLAGLRAATSEDLPKMQLMLSTGLRADDGRYGVHPGDLAWWWHHEDPRNPLTYWVQDDAGVVVLDQRRPEINVFTLPGCGPFDLMEWCQRRLGHNGEVGWVADSDDELIDYLTRDGYEMVHVYRSFEWDLRATVIPEPALAVGWSLRPVAGEDEANTRREAAHAAFESTLEADRHLQRYLDFMRSPVYVPENDLVAVSPDGRIASFMIWWDDPTGIAQIEPFGTHPDFQRRGVGTALLRYGLRRMKEAGMTAARVLTDEPRAAVDFYKAAGFEAVGRVGWWAKPSTGNGDDELQ